MVADVQADLVRELWDKAYRPGVTDVIKFVNMISERLILPGGHVATVLRRLGYEAEAALYLKWHIAESRSKDKRRKAGRASAEAQGGQNGALSDRSEHAKPKKSWKYRPAAG